MPDASCEDWEIITTILGSLRTDSDLYDDIDYIDGKLTWPPQICALAFQSRTGRRRQKVRQEEPRIRGRNRPDSRGYSTRRAPHHWNLESLRKFKLPWLSWADGKCPKKSKTLKSLNRHNNESLQLSSVSATMYVHVPREYSHLRIATIASAEMQVPGGISLNEHRPFTLG